MTNPREYQPIDPKDRNPKRSVEYRMRDRRRYFLKHIDRHLMALSPDETSLAIFYRSVNVVLWGRALGDIAAAIDGQNVAWVQAFDPERWDKPTDGRAVFVERMEVFMKKNDEDGQPKHEPETERRARATPESAKH